MCLYRRKYWSAGVTLPELLVFIRRGSYDPISLRIASMEQLGMLMQDLEPLALTYEECVARRNDNRVMYENVVVDYLWARSSTMERDGTCWHALRYLSCGAGACSPSTRQKMRVTQKLRKRTHNSMSHLSTLYFSIVTVLPIIIRTMNSRNASLSPALMQFLVSSRIYLSSLKQVTYSSLL